MMTVSVQLDCWPGFNEWIIGKTGDCPSVDKRFQDMITLECENFQEVEDELSMIEKDDRIINIYVTIKYKIPFSNF
jgi:hypothetical protein